MNEFLFLKTLKEMLLQMLLETKLKFEISIIMKKILLGLF